MGAGASVDDDILITNHRYAVDRKVLRKKLAALFGSDPDNHDVLKKIKQLQNILIKNSDICSTAAKEFKNRMENLPTNHESALRYFLL